MLVALYCSVNPVSDCSGSHSVCVTMASSLALILDFKNVLRLGRSNWIPVLSQVRWSNFPPNWLDPVYKKDELQQLTESGIAKERAFQPIKPAKTNETSSVFHDPLVNKFINILMNHGDKETARSLMEKTFENIKRIQLEKYHKAPEAEKAKIERNPFKILHAAVKNSMPVIHVTPIKRGGATYQVPVPISENRARFRAMKWLRDAGQDKDKNMRFHEKFAWELIEAANNEGRVIKRKQELHRQCEANRAYAHYRWS